MPVTSRWRGSDERARDASEAQFTERLESRVLAGPSEGHTLVPGWSNVEYGLMNAVDPSQPGSILCASFSREDIEAMAEEDETIYVRECSDWRTLDSEPDDPPEPEIPEGYEPVPRMACNVAAEAIVKFVPKVGPVQASLARALADAFVEAARGGRPQWPGTDQATNG